jgi:hypothetical protein
MLRRIITLAQYIKESILFILYKKVDIRIYDLDYDIKDPILKTAIRNRKRRIVRFKDGY